MTATGLETFDRTLHKTNQWLAEVLDELGYGDRGVAYHAVRAVLHTLRDALPPAEVTDLAAQLPLLLKGVFFDGWSGRRAAEPPREPAAFLAEVAARYDGPSQPPDSEALTRAVLAVLRRHVSDGEISDVMHVLPQKLGDLWPAEA